MHLSQSLTCHAFKPRISTQVSLNKARFANVVAATALRRHWQQIFRCDSWANAACCRCANTKLESTVAPHPACVAYSGFRLHIRPSRQAQVHESILVQDVSLWACLAGFAVAAGELHVAETAFAGCEEVDKLQYMAYIQQLPGRETRLAELALYRHNVTEAEAILLQVAAVSWHCTET